jgi:DMSO/TMAO reductase YedYZ molybdopterin-dependent catalytic subunit
MVETLGELTMKRRQVLQRLVEATGGVMVATLLPACGKELDPLFLLNLLDPAEPLPDHLLTPVGEFYVQSYALPPSIERDSWRLEIAGMVDRPLTLTLQDILAAPQEEFYLTMECIGNPAGGNLIGNALWTGTPVLPFLRRVGVKPEATEFVLHGADFYETTLPVAEVMRPDVRLVYQMNGAPLTKSHGYPVRILIPGHFGQKQPKWLTKIEAIAQRKRGYWERQGWSNTAEIPTHALTRQVQGTRVWNRKHQVSLPKTGEKGWNQGVLVAGVALDSSSPIQNITISTDGGKTWHSAEQNQPDSPHEWTLWRYRWQPQQPGTYTLLARAQSQRQTQPLDDSQEKDGSSAVLRIQVTLEAA